jgi:putative acetyltransferase
MIEVRLQRSGDGPAVRRVNELAFGRPDEADLVERLGADCPDLLSMVAVDEDEIVGHVLFSPVRLELDGGGELEGQGLAPVAVLPSHQNRGIGSMLVTVGLAEIRTSPCPFVVVLGHPTYYPRFGFERASVHGFRCQWKVRDDAFMLIVLDEAAMAGRSGTIRYRPEFDALE